MAAGLPRPLTPELAELISRRFRVLADPTRILLLDRLSEGPATVGELREATGFSQQNVSKHLQLLHQQGLVARRKEGTATLYRIADPVVFKLCDLVCGSLGLPTLHPRVRRTAAAR